MNRMTPRIRDVARVAGVSTATVSRALSRPEVVSPATLEAVLAAVRVTGYTINQAARNLRQQRTGGIVALVPNLANPFFSRILAGIGGGVVAVGVKAPVV
jgi:LacI family transcriptional regulator, repressor for deo operon, udp, cdd, tsx, nupC, and nupG